MSTVLADEELFETGVLYGFDDTDDEEEDPDTDPDKVGLDDDLLADGLDDEVFPDDEDEDVDPFVSGGASDEDDEEE